MAAIGGEPDPAPGVLQVLDVSRCPNVGRDALDVHPRVGGWPSTPPSGRLCILDYLLTAAYEGPAVMRVVPAVILRQGCATFSCRPYWRCSEQAGAAGCAAWSSSCRRMRPCAACSWMAADSCTRCGACGIAKIKHCRACFANDERGTKAIVLCRIHELLTDSRSVWHNYLQVMLVAHRLESLNVSNCGQLRSVSLRCRCG